MSSDKKKTILTIKNTLKKMDLLRVHIYEYSIRFDKKINDAIHNYPELNAEVVELNNLWKNNKIDEQDILKIVLYLVGKYGSYLKDYYFTQDDLDENGCYIDKDMLLNSEANLDDENIFFYEYFKEQNALKKISKKEFEKEISDETTGCEYVEKYIFKGAKFYKGILEEDKFTSTWYFMMVNDNLEMAFEKITH